MVIRPLHFKNTVNLTQTTFETYVFFLQQIIIYFSTFLLILLILSLILSSFNNKNSIFTKFFNFIKLLSMTTISLLFLTVFVKFNYYLWNFSDYCKNLKTEHSFDIQVLNQFKFSDITINGSILSDVVTLLALSSGLVCLYLLGDKNLVKHTSNLNIFSVFFLAILTMVYTSNLLVMFVSFEFLFLPTLYFVHSHGYVQRVDKTLKILLYWTLFGAFLVLTSLAYLYFKYKTLNYYRLTNENFSELESWILCLAIFIGFGIKIPVTPFHYWLTKIHVEAPAGFSIFLSGFLVKAALYCFYFFNLIFVNEKISSFICVIAFLGIAESSIKMWTQTDFKKLIAYATIQEMNLILFLLIGSQNSIDYASY
jgi:NADH:ubiquinone oxidoreductase subunit 4 (subunit M)